MKTIEEWLNLTISKSTKNTYKSALNYYFNTLGIEASNYFKEKRNYESDVEKFFIKILRMEDHLKQFSPI